MGFSKGFFHIVLRVATLVSLSVALAYSYFITELVVTPVMFGILILIVAIEMSWHLQKQERNWIRFLQSVRYQDFNRVYEKQASKELRDAYELITQSMEELKSNKEAEFRLLQTVLGHISVAVACYRNDGEVVFTNKAFDTLMDLQGMIHVDRLKNRHPTIHQVMTAPEGAPSEWIDHADGQKLFAKTESFKLKRKSHKLISLTDIRSSLDAKELESYQKLMRVMTHEIMNSATPILSLIRVVNGKLLNGPELAELDKKGQRNISTSLSAIEVRTAGILKFVEAYKQINKSIQPYLTPIQSKELIRGISPLLNLSSNTNLIVNDFLNDTMILDRALISQVLINLVKNAADAVQNVVKAEIAITISKEENSITIVVEDNGSGIKPNDVNQIFVPFYTTKTEGSGIGLALSRQIIKAHGGWIVYERESEKTKFTLTLPQ